MLGVGRSGRSSRSSCATASVCRTACRIVQRCVAIRTAGRATLTEVIAVLGVGRSARRSAIDACYTNIGLGARESRYTVI